MEILANIAPLGDRVLVKPDPVQDRTESGIVLANAEASQEYPDTGVVIALPEIVLPGFDDPKDFVRVGDRVLFDRYKGDEVKVNKDKFKVLLLENIYAILLPIL